MVSKCLNFVILTVISLLLQGAACFFVKHVKTGMCINVTGIVEDENHIWGNLSFVGLTNNCLDPTVQNRFLDNTALLNLKTMTCFEGTLRRSKKGHDLPMLYLLRATDPKVNCRDIDHAVTQTPWGGLSIYYLPDKRPRCAVPKTHSGIKNQGIDIYIGLEANCADAEDKRFNFGSVTCSGNAIKNANCPKDQYMVIKTASYRKLSPTKTCGLSDDYSCEVDVTCLVKKQCGGLHACNITVNDTLFSGNECPGSTKYLYFEYQCNDTATPFDNLCAPEGPPLNVTVTAESSSSLSVTWKPPEKDKRNGMIVSYIVCVAHEENKPCFKIQTTKETMLVIESLSASTKYYVRVLASTRVGNGPYSESKVKFTHGKKTESSTNGTAYTLTFFLQIPPRNFTYLFVVVLKLKDGKESRSSGSYENNELVTYSEAEQSTDPKPYIAAILTSKDGNMFVLGDGRNTSIPTSRRRRSTSSTYYNGPLEPDHSYSIFQRIFIDTKGDYYSTDWSPPSKTGEYSGGPRVLTKVSSDDIKAKEGDLVNLLCSGQGEPPITFSWEKDKKSLESFMEKEKPQRSSLLVVTVKDETSFGNYICHIRDRFRSTTHTITVQKYTEDDQKYFVGIIVLSILLVIALAIIAYFTCRNCRPESPKANAEDKSKDKNNSDNYENPDNIQDDANFEQVEDEASNYTPLKKTGKDESDDQLYAHLNEVDDDYENQEETGI